MKKRKPEDRRVQRTRALLQDALMALMVERGYEATTVQDIIDRANVGRATFYAHFADKNTLLTSRLEDLRATLLQRQREALASEDAGEFSFSRAMLEHAAGGLPLWRALASSESGTFVLRRIQEMLADLVRNDLAALGMSRPSSHREMLVGHVTGAFMGTMTWWLDDGARLSPAEVDESFRKIATHGITAELRPRSREAR